MVCRSRLLKRATLSSPTSLVTLGLIAGLALGMFFETEYVPAWFAEGTVSLFEPIGALWINALRATVIPLVVPLLIVGVAGGSDFRLVGRLGGKAFLVFLAMLLVCAAATALLAPPLFDYLVLDPQNTARLRESALIDQPPADALTVRGWLISLIPVNIIEAGASGALLPVVLFALAYAFALTRQKADAKVHHVEFFRTMSDVMLTLVSWILALAPIGIFGVALATGHRLGRAVIGAIGFYIAVVVSFHIVAIIALYAVISISRRVSVVRFARSLIPAQAVGFGTRSSLASLPALVQGATDQLHLPPAVVAFILPLAVSVFKLTSAIYWIIGALFVSKLYGIPLGAGEIVLVGAASVLLSFSTPGIPSGGMLLQLPIYASIGLPAEGIGILIALDTVPDMFKTTLNVTADMATAVLVTPRDVPGA